MGCGVVAFKPTFCELEQEGLGCRNLMNDPKVALTVLSRLQPDETDVSCCVGFRMPA
jgi:hypothetical protein